VIRPALNKEQLSEATFARQIWLDFNTALLESLFSNSKIANEYDAARPYPANYIGTPTFQAEATYYRSATARNVNVLESILERLSLIQEDSEQTEPLDQTPASKAAGSTVFVVHGHDELARTQIVSFLTTLELTPIVLADQPNKGHTVIEKLEFYAGQASFAIVLLTPDDLGHAKTDQNERPRARQNVVLELGYFIGKLGRAKTCALYKKGVELPDMELPSDFTGVVYTLMDQFGAWKLLLGRELREAGFDVDLNRLL